jgi:hypothetical protein
VNADDATKVGWREMPFVAILDELDRRTAGRVIRADASWIAAGTIPTQWTGRSSGSLTVVGIGPDGLWVDLDVF